MNKKEKGNIKDRTKLTKTKKEELSKVLEDFAFEKKLKDSKTPDRNKLKEKFLEDVKEFLDFVGDLKGVKDKNRINLLETAFKNAEDELLKPNKKKKELKEKKKELDELMEIKRKLKKGKTPSNLINLGYDPNKVEKVVHNQLKN
ncbi:MAG: hypothetical protein BTN85_0832 [Candidatus Methanohalarchaeum thermophilum]|uniref:Uncharacterized protein n=1 Tax=Methanohalarchaeum thermophilum TaxID=1903181 RepID=A0A1Q6DVK3_METT1|nr:MAG: hypothetical protein BTN85_0832 [Candidatus Methanohalarchaeum thermophilum]